MSNPTTPEEIEVARAKIQAAVDAHLAQGGRIISGAFGVSKNPETQKNECVMDSYGRACCCPMGAVGMTLNCVDNPSLADWGQELGWDGSQIWSFIRGFDNTRCISGDPLVHALGQEFRKKLNPGFFGLGPSS